MKVAAAANMSIRRSHRKVSGSIPRPIGFPHQSRY